VDTSLKRSGRVRVTAGASGGRLGGDWGVPAYGGVRDIGAYLTHSDAHQLRSIGYTGE